MSEITITPRAQALVLIAILGAIAAAIAAQFPEIRRYLKIETM
jgi:hypothetical protein